MIKIPHYKKLNLILKNSKNLASLLDTRIDIMTYQFGEFVKFFKIYSKVYKILNDGYVAESRLCLSNLLIQIELFCISNDWDVDVLRDEGYEHLLDKIKEVEAKGGKMI